jgi:hypothetical protein
VPHLIQFVFFWWFILISCISINKLTSVEALNQFFTICDSFFFHFIIKFLVPLGAKSILHLGVPNQVQRSRSIFDQSMGAMGSSGALRV